MVEDSPIRQYDPVMRPDLFRFELRLLADILVRDERKFFIHHGPPLIDVTDPSKTLVKTNYITQLPMLNY